MSDFQIFDSPEFGEIRAVMIDDEPWFVGKDVAEALGYSNAIKAVTAHVDDEDRGIIQNSQNGSFEFQEQNCKNDSFGFRGQNQKFQNGTFEIPNRGLTIINESGLYSLIMSSKLPSAKKFKRWVTSEVLPSLRRTGVYAVPVGAGDTELERPLTRDDYINAAKIFSSCRNERLPMVFAMLTKAGLDMSKVPCPVRKPRSRAGRKLQSSVGNNDLARAIDDAIVNKGISASQIADVVGCHRTEICNYRTGVREANEAKAAAILDAISYLEKTAWDRAGE